MLRAARGTAALRVQSQLTFRLDALLGLSASLLSLLGGLLLFDVTLRQVASIAGWRRPDVLALVGTCSLLVELEQGMLRGLRRLPALVKAGRLELHLLRPLPAPFLLACCGINVDAAWRLPLGAAVVAYAAHMAPPVPGRWLVYVFSLLASLGIYGLLSWSLLCLSFWIIEMNNLSYVVYDLMEFARYPVSVFRGAARVLLSTVLPFLVLANVPVRILMRDASPSLLLHQLLVLLGFGALGWLLWRRGLRKYQGASL